MIFKLTALIFMYATRAVGWKGAVKTRAAANIFYNKKQKQVNDSVRKEQVTDFKKRNRIRAYFPAIVVYLFRATKTLKQVVKPT